jgi:hypothetical protein
VVSGFNVSPAAAAAAEAGCSMTEDARVEKPQVGETLVFVKLSEGRPWYTTFRLHFDGSCGFFFPTEGPEPPPGSMLLGPGFIIHAKFRRSPDVWRRAFERMAEIGFLPLAEAQRRGWLPSDWAVPEWPAHTDAEPEAATDRPRD